MLAHNTSLHHLALSWNTISDPGAHDFAKVLKHNSTLQQLDMADNRISSGGATELARALEVCAFFIFIFFILTFWLDMADCLCVCLFVCMRCLCVFVSFM